VTPALAGDAPVNYTGWYGWEGYHPFVEGDPWGLMLEGYLKRDEVALAPLSWFARVGLNYQLPSGHRLTGGYAVQYNHPYDEESEPYHWWDHRLWEQFMYRNPWGDDGLSLLMLRFRAEQRWLQRKDLPGGSGSTNWDFEHTFRVMVRSNFAVGTRTFLAAYDELHMRLSPTDENLYDQNRCQGKSFSTKLGDTIFYDPVPGFLA
jgi:hypothetical protein